MTIEEVRERVKKVVSKQLKVPLEEIKDSSDFVKNLGAESIQSLELIAAFEQEFDIIMDEDAAFEVKTVGGAAEFIKKMCDQQGR